MTQQLQPGRKIFWMPMFIICLFSFLCIVPSTYAAPPFSLVEPATVPPSWAYTYVEAETAPSGEVKSDFQASSGYYVSQTVAYRPIIVVPLPAESDSFTIWARVRGVALQLTGISADGSQHALNWVWEIPSKWKWVSFGRHTRTELGGQISLVCAPHAAPNAGLDAVFLAPDPRFLPAKMRIESGVGMPGVVYANWTKTGSAVGSYAYGLNASRVFDPTVANNPKYQKGLGYMAPGLLRVYNASMLKDSTIDADGWMDYAHKGWDVEKITKALAGFMPGTALLINIPTWPSWMDENHDGFLDTDQFDAYAKLCAKLVQIVNRDLHADAFYWELLNEPDKPYFIDFHSQNGWGPLKDAAKPDRVEELARIYGHCAAAMKAVVPTIQVGGPAQGRPDLTMFTERFARAAGRHLDFFSYHAYASADIRDTDIHVFDTATGLAYWADDLNKALAAALPGRRLPIFLDAYNISWTREIRDPRMTNIKGVVFDALVMASAVEHGVAVTAAWNECDDIYGKMDDHYNLRPSATLFRLMNVYMKGTTVSSSFADRAVVTMAVKTTGGHSLMLINRTNIPQGVDLSGCEPRTPNRHELSSIGFVESTLTAAQLDAPLTLPAYSVTFLTH